MLMMITRHLGRRSFCAAAGSLTQKVALPDASVNSPHTWHDYISSAYQDKVPPKRVYLTELLQSCTDEAHMKVAVSTLEIYKRKRQPICKDNCSLFITKCCDLGVPEIAYGVIYRKRHSPIERSSITAASLTHLVKALADVGELDMSFKLNTVALKLDIERDASTLAVLIRGCVEASDHERILKMMEWKSPHENQWWEPSTFQLILDGNWEAEQKTGMVQGIQELWAKQPSLKTEANEATLQTWAETEEVALDEEDL